MDQNQEKCVSLLDKNLQIVACAGAGKTTTIVKRLINILNKRLAKPSEIVAMTFTEKATGEFKERIFSEYEKENGNLLGLSEIRIGTIHNFCIELLKEYFSEYRKYDVSSDIQVKLMVKKEFSNPYNDLESFFSNLEYKDSKGNIRNRCLQPQNWSHIATVLSAVSIIREEQIPDSELPLNLRDFLHKYIKLLESYKTFDYTEIQNKFLIELKQNEGFRGFIKNNIKYIFIDEYQDVNSVQEAILQEIHSISNKINICVVGDDDQLIYQWRGSNIRNFIEFDDRYYNTNVEYLDTNYRSSEGIVRTAEMVVLANKQRKAKDLKSSNKYPYEPGDIIAKADFSDIGEETEFIIKSIKKLKGSIIKDKNGIYNTISFDDIAILVHSPSKFIEFNKKLFSELENNNIPYIIEGTKRLFDTPEIRDIIALFFYFNQKYANNINPMFFGEDFQGFSLKKDLQYFDLTLDQIDQIDNKFKAYSKNHIYAQKQVFYDFTLQELYQDILILLGVLNLDTTDVINEKMLYNLGAFSSIINDFEKVYFRTLPKNRIREFIKFLMYDVREVYPEGWLSPGFSSVKCLKIMSYHKSKGLEYPVIFLPHLCTDYLFPVKSGGGFDPWGLIDHTNLLIKIKSRYKEKDESLSRLFYVGITRSKKYLFMSKAKEYLKPGKSKPNNKIPKPFANASKSPFVNYDHNKFLDRQLQYNDMQVPSEDEHVTFDFSTLKDFFECPHKFKLNSIMGFHSPLNVRMGYGRSIHNILEHIHRSYKSNGVILNNDSDINSLMDTYLHLPYGNHMEKLMESIRLSVYKVIKNYIDLNSKSFSDIELIEQRIDYKLNDYVFVNGRVDLVKNNRSGEVIIVDFKSSDKAIGNSSKDIQLYFYALGYYKFTGIAPTAIHSYDISNSNSVPIPISKTDLSDVEDKIMEVYDRIKNKDFCKVNREESNSCKACVYYASCNI
jgi:DNA helicase-2/ATP-dependent DNA helicase PcrA